MTENSKQANQKQLVLELLQGVLARLEQPGTWSRLALCRDREGKQVPVNSPNVHSCCIHGALLLTCVKTNTGKSTLRTAINVLNKLCRIVYGNGVKKHGTEDDLSEFSCFPLTYTNDSLVKNHAEAKRLLNAAIKSLADDNRKQAAGTPGQQPATSQEAQAQPTPLAASQEAPPLPDPTESQATPPPAASQEAPPLPDPTEKQETPPLPDPTENQEAPPLPDPTERQETAASQEAPSLPDPTERQETTAAPGSVSSEGKTRVNPSSPPEAGEQSGKKWSLASTRDVVLQNAANKKLEEIQSRDVPPPPGGENMAIADTADRVLQDATRKKMEEVGGNISPPPAGEDNMEPEQRPATAGEQPQPGQQPAATAEQPQPGQQPATAEQSQPGQQPAPAEQSQPGQQTAATAEQAQPGQQPAPAAEQSQPEQQTAPAAEQAQPEQQTATTTEQSQPEQQTAPAAQPGQQPTPPVAGSATTTEDQFTLMDLSQEPVMLREEKEVDETLDKVIDLDIDLPDEK